MASSKHWFDRNGQTKAFDDFWHDEDGSEVYHFIGKDIVYHHTLFWPALLWAGGFRAPTAVHVHGFLTVDGEKMSKSRGTFIRASTYAKYYNAASLRYYYASKLTENLDDLDLVADELSERYNSDVVGVYTNIFSRLCTKLADNLDRRLSAGLSADGEALFSKGLETARRACEHYLARRTGRAIRDIRAFSDEINRLVTKEEPWKTIKTDPERARQAVTDALSAGRILAALLKPVLPDFVAKVEKLLNLPEELTFRNLDWRFPPEHTLQAYEALAVRLDKKNFKKMIEEERQAAAPTKASGPAGDSLIGIDELGKVELRAGRILLAEAVKDADRLFRLEVDVGEEKPRQVFAGLRGAYKADELNGLTAVVVANLQPRKMKFGVSEAMLLASGEGKDVSLYVPHKSAKPGDRLR